MKQLSIDLTETSHAQDTDTAQRLRAASVALEQGRPLAQVLLAIHGDAPSAPADNVVALVRRVPAPLPARPRRALLQHLCASTCVHAGKVFFRAPEAARQLAALLEPHRERVRTALEAGTRAAPPGDELVAVHDCYGALHRVLRADLDDPTITLLPRYRRNGTPVPGNSPLHRDNVDQDRSKARAA